MLCWIGDKPLPGPLMAVFEFTETRCTYVARILYRITINVNSKACLKAMSFLPMLIYNARDRGVASESELPYVLLQRI